MTGGLGAAVPARSFGYDPASGAQATVSSTAGTLTTSFDDFGRVVSYTEPGSTTTTSYDTAGRIAAISDGKGSRTYGYNAAGERRGLATSVTVSGLGAITGVYGSDGELVSQSLPSGVDQAWTRDETGTPQRLAVVREQTQMKFKYIRAAWFTAVVALLSLAIATEPASSRKVLALQVGATFIAVSLLVLPFVNVIRRPGGMRLGAIGYCLVGFMSVLVAHLIPDGSEGIIVCAAGFALPSAFFFRPPPGAR